MVSDIGFPVVTGSRRQAINISRRRGFYRPDFISDDYTDAPEEIRNRALRHTETAEHLSVP
jgi:hypothetical protein